MAFLINIKIVLKLNTITIPKKIITILIYFQYIAHHYTAHIYESWCMAAYFY